MKKLVFAFALLCSSSLLAQFSFNATSDNGIESATNTASGNYSTAMGFQTTASGDASTAMGEYSTASGDRSIAMGSVATASGENSFALGYQSQASALNSIAMGAFTNASGGASIAIGGNNEASGTFSTVIGKNIRAQDYGSFIIGSYNETDLTPNPNEFSYENVAFAIGNGTESANRSDALSVLFDGTTTIAGNVTAPAFIGDGSQLTNLPLSFNATSGNGIESATNTASGNYSTAMGEYTTSSGFVSTAMGSNANASGDYSTAMGVVTKASGNGATAMGSYTNASGNGATAMGAGSTASGDYTTASGVNSVASGLCSTALGAGPQAIGGWSTALGGFTIANGRLSTAMGEETITDDYGTTVIGVWNKKDETPNPDTFSFENSAFVIGNGGYDSEGNWLGGADETRSNAFEVLFDGTTTIAGDLNINSDARLKANIISLGATLSKLLQIDGKTYTMKKDANHKKKIGLLAQDIEKVFPELVTETNDIKSVNYQGLVPVLINAMKEQDEVIRSQDSRLISQETKLNKQQQEIDELKAMVKALAKG